MTESRSAATGADQLVTSLADAGVEVCFANPGTSEMHLVAALDSNHGIRTVLGLFEGVVAAAADGYGRMARKPAATLFHLGPGLSNGSAYLHNAQRAHTPIVAVVGDHATYHRQYNAPLTSDIEGLARPVSGWVRRVSDPASLSHEASLAVAAAHGPPGCVATLILPADIAWTENARPALPVEHARPRQVDVQVIDAIAKILTTADAGRAALLLGGSALSTAGLDHAGRIAAARGVRLICERFPARLRRGDGEVPVERLPYFAEQTTAALDGLQHLILVGAEAPVAFFAHPAHPSWLTPSDCALSTLALRSEDVVGALAQLGDRVGSTHVAPSRAARSTAPIPAQLNQYSVGAILATHLPDEAIVVDEAITSALGPFTATAGAAPHDYLTLTGGAIGHGIPMAIGAAVACPDRKVVCLEGDGSALYTPQALWTAARENLDITILIFNNAAYSILNHELKRFGISELGDVGQSLLKLGRPAVDWVALSTSLGVEASRAASVDQLTSQLRSALVGRGPRLIDVVMP